MKGFLFSFLVAATMFLAACGAQAPAESLPTEEAMPLPLITLVPPIPTSTPTPTPVPTQPEWFETAEGMRTVVAVLNWIYRGDGVYGAEGTLRHNFDLNMMPEGLGIVLGCDLYENRNGSIAVVYGYLCLEGSAPLPEGETLVPPEARVAFFVHQPIKAPVDGKWYEGIISK